ncbi:MAG: protein kinase, partial [Polyangiaceae bacterium]|nr:protein kinase [Polyangiaceae bacterium]
GGFLRPVVIKRILPIYANDRSFGEMFLDEARIAASIRHPNVVHVEDLGVEEGEPYIVMEYLAGETAAALVERTRLRKEALELPLALHVVEEVLAGLHAAHEVMGPDGSKRGVVHRDVSPQNVMLTYDGHVKVLDFGIAHTENRIAKTSTGEIKGKIAYMSPEQCRGESLDARSDIFSTGVMLYELVTSRHPFRRPDEAATLMALFSGDYAPLGSEAGRFTAALEKILARSMTPAKEMRFATAAEMRRDIARLARSMAGDEPMEAVLAARMKALFSDRANETQVLASAAPREQLETVPETSTSAPAAGTAAQVDRQVGRYLIHELLGTGGMAEVFYGTLSAAGGISRPVAIKKLHPQLVADKEARTILLDEARLVARVQHPNVVSLLDVVSERDDLFLVLEYVHGETVASLRRAAPGPIEPAVAVGIAIGALEGLHAAHVATDTSGASLGIVHRDVSPQNIIVGADGMTRVLDFGIAKAQGRAQQATRTGLIKGKLAYMAPEQLRTGIASVRSDVFSAALVLWELLVGKRVFDGESDAAIRTQVLTMPIPRLGEVSAAGRAIEDVLSKALERDPALRYESAGAFAAALENALTPATPRRIGAWLEGHAAAALAQRAAAVRRFTTQSGIAKETSAGTAGDADSAAHPLSVDTPPGLTPIEPTFQGTRRRRALLAGAVTLALGGALALGAIALTSGSGAPSGVTTPAAATTSSSNRVSNAASSTTQPIATEPLVAPEPSMTHTQEAPTASATGEPKSYRNPPRKTAPTQSAPATAPSCKLVPQTDARGIVTFQRVCK